MKRYKLINNLKQEKIIFAENLDDAEAKANKIFKKWIDIIEIIKCQK